MWDAVWSLLQPQPWHPNIIRVCPYPNFSKFGPYLHRYYSTRVTPICPFTAYQGAKTLHIHPICMLDAVSGGPQPQPWFHNIIWCNLTTPFFQKITDHPPEQVLQCKGAPICPSRVYECAQTLHIPPIWMLDAVWDLLQPQPWHHNVIWLNLTPPAQVLQ